jgi:hypothetical protein
VVDEEVTFLKIENPPKSPLEALQKPCYLLVGVLLIRRGYSPIHLPRWGRLTKSAIVLNVATNSPINQNLKYSKLIHPDSQNQNFNFPYRSPLPMVKFPKNNHQISYNLPKAKSPKRVEN